MITTSAQFNMIFVFTVHKYILTSPTTAVTRLSLRPNEVVILPQ